jgi:hypothetical protein
MAEQDDLPYLSPARKLIRFFRKSRDGWKAKHQDAKALIKRLENRVRFLEKSKDEWKVRVKALEAENARLKAQVEQIKDSVAAQTEVKKKASESSLMGITPSFSVWPRHHDYSLGVITFAILLQVSALVGLRGVEKVLRLVTLFFPLFQSTPSWSSSRLWLLRVGYYKLVRAKQIADDWVWIIDFTIQAGRMKCLTILGVRLSLFSNGRQDKTLCHEDMEPIEVVPVQQANGELVYQRLREAIQKTGVPRQIIADEGPDVKSGIQKFIQQHPQTDFIYDVKHFTANLLEREFKGDLMWTEFTGWANQMRSQLHQTALSHLEPPNQRAKSRYMNMDLLVEWGLKTLSFLDSLAKPVKTELEIQAIQKLDWIFQWRKDLAEWYQILCLIQTTEAFVRTNGFFPKCDRPLREMLRLDPGATRRAFQIRWDLIAYVLDASDKAKPGECLLGSSEVLESVFGKFKYMQAEHAKGSLTGMILAIPAMVSKTTEAVVQRAVETVPVHQVRDWIKEKFGKSAITKRREAFSGFKKTEQKSDQLLLSA